jgi:hypothetical protein
MLTNPGLGLDLNRRYVVEDDYPACRYWAQQEVRRLLLAIQ